MPVGRQGFLAPPVAGLLRGHFANFEQDKLGFVERTSREYGDFVPLRFGPYRFWFVTDPATVGEMLTTRAASFRKDFGLRRTRVLLGNGLLTSEGEDHERQSREAQPAFRHKAVESYAPAIVGTAAEVIESWPDGGEID